jgi:hypothetical protein
MEPIRLHGCAVVVVVSLTGQRIGIAGTVTKPLLPIRRGTFQKVIAYLLPVWVGNFLKKYGPQSRMFCLWRSGSALHQPIFVRQAQPEPTACAGP